MYNLTGIYWIKDEARYLPEYIEFHLLQGFDHFIFYNNGSTDNLHEIMEPYIKDGIVEIRNYPEYDIGAKNFWVMNHCINEQRGISKWIHFHAIDERLFSPSGENIIDILNEFKDYGGLSVAWRMFNSNNHETRPDGLIIENYSHYVDDLQFHIKTLIQPELTISHGGDPHHFHHLPGHPSVTEKKNIQNGPFCNSEYSMDRIKLHHYVTLSKEEFDNKMNKGVLDFGAASENSRRTISDTQWHFLHSSEWKKDESIFKFIQPVRNAILKRYEGREELLQFINH